MGANVDDRRLNRELEECIEDNVVNYAEYQNKYFLKKRIKEIFPHRSDDFIYRAIEYANSNIKLPRKRKVFIKLLLEKLNKYNIDSYQIWIYRNIWTLMVTDQISKTNNIYSYL